MTYRLPIWVFHIHQGWIVGEHFLLLTHTGRKSGLPRQTVLEVLQHDKASDTYYVLAGFGEKSDWLQNVEKTPEVVIAVGRRQFHRWQRALRQKKLNSKCWTMLAGILWLCECCRA